jgi:hypothetical protein
MNHSPASQVGPTARSGATLPEAATCPNQYWHITDASNNHIDYDGNVGAFAHDEYGFLRTPRPFVGEGSLAVARLEELVAGINRDASPDTLVAHCRMHHQLIAKKPGMKG